MIATLTCSVAYDGLRAARPSIKADLADKVCVRVMHAVKACGLEPHVAYMVPNSLVR